MKRVPAESTAGEVSGDRTTGPREPECRVWVLFWVPREGTEGTERGKDIIWLIFLEARSGCLEPGKAPRDERRAVRIDREG